MSGTQSLCPQQMLRARANGETFVSATMCPRLPGPLNSLMKISPCGVISVKMPQHVSIAARAVRVADAAGALRNILHFKIVS